MSKKQRTLADFGFTKTIIHRGNEMKVDIPNRISDSPPKLKCPNCEQTFLNQQGLSIHILCKHSATNKKENNDPSGSCKRKIIDTEEGKSQEESIIEESVNGKELEKNEGHVDIQPEEQVDDSAAASKKTKYDRRRGQEKRKSVTNKFKAKVIAAVESGEKAISVADRFNVNRLSLIHI